MEKATNYTITNENQFPAIDLEDVDAEFQRMISQYREEWVSKTEFELTLTENGFICRDKKEDVPVFETFLQDSYADSAKVIRKKFVNEVNKAIEEKDTTVVNVWIVVEGLSISSYTIDTMYGVQESGTNNSEVYMQSPEGDGSITIDFDKMSEIQVQYDEYDQREWHFHFGKTGMMVQVTIWK